MFGEIGKHLLNGVEEESTVTWTGMGVGRWKQLLSMKICSLLIWISILPFTNHVSENLYENSQQWVVKWTVTMPNIKSLSVA